MVFTLNLIVIREENKTPGKHILMTGHIITLPGA
jgi:hypothetical protein